MDNTPYTADQVHRDAKFTGLIYESVADGITAAPGGGQANAVQLTTELARVATVATAGDSVRLPAAIPGLTLCVTNHGAKAMQVYGNGSDTINDVAASTGIMQMSGSECIFACYGLGLWYVNGLGTGYAGSLETQSALDALTAHAGGGQGLAFPITTMISRFTVVASAGDSAILPVGVAGLSLTVINATANSMNIFPDTGSTINGAGANVAYALAAGKTAQFVTTIAGAWHALLSA
jgi:hypothetical protein